MINTNRFFKDCDELTKFIDKILDKYADQPSIYYTGNFHKYFIDFKQVNRYEHERAADKLNNNQDHRGVNCYNPSGNGCFLKCNN